MPCPRTEHTATLVGKSTVIVFGGLDDQNKQLNDSQALDMESQVWKRVIAKVLPHVRQSHAACEGNDNLLQVMGGRGSDVDKVLADLWALDVGREEWTQITDVSEENGSPADRMSHAMGYSHPNLIVGFGARFVGIVLDDVWVTDMSSNQKKWVKLEKLAHSPCARFTLATCMDSEGAIYVHGGVNQNYETVGGTQVLSRKLEWTQISEDTENVVEQSTMHFINGILLTLGDDHPLEQKVSAFDSQAKNGWVTGKVSIGRLAHASWVQKGHI